MVEKPQGGNSQPNENQDEGNASPNYVTVEQVAQIVNSAITNRNRQFESKLDEKFSKLESLLTPKEAEKTEETEATKGAAKPLKVSLEPKVSQLETQLKALQAERLKGRDQNLKLKVQQQLIDAGVNPKVVKSLIAMHIDADKSISYTSDESDEIVFRQGDYNVPLDEGISSWIKSEDAKPFLTPKGTAGSGDKPYTQTQSQSPQKGDRPTKEQFGNLLLSKLTGFGSNE